MIGICFATGFEEIEAITTLDILRRAELDVLSIGVASTTIVGAHGIAVGCDILDSKVDIAQLEMLVLPGGMPGTINLEASSSVQKMIDYVVEKDLWLAAICAAPSILGHKGILKGKRVTCFPGFDSQLGEGAFYTGERLVQDGKLITAKGPGATIPFALRLVSCMLGEERAKLLEASLQ